MRRTAARLVTQFISKRKSTSCSAMVCVVGVLLLGIGALLLSRPVTPPPPESSEKNPPRPDARAAEKALEDETPREIAKAPQKKMREMSKENALKKASPDHPVKSPPKEEKLTTKAGKFSRADTVIGVLMAHKVTRSEIQKVLDSVREKRVFSRIRAGRRYEVRKSEKDGAFHEFVFQLDNERRLRISRSPNGAMVATKEAIPYSIDVVRIQSRIDSSLYQAIADGGGSPVLVNKLSDIFAYVIDFHKDLQSGDRVEVLVERKHLRDEFTGYGRILAAEFVVGNRRHSAVYFERGGGRYYDFDGESLRRAFLRSPLRYTRISSRFSKRRFHPLLKRYRPHFGVDYAAPRGTPVYAVADGVVAWAGRKSQAGKTVELRHGGGYRTAYLHLYRYARGIRTGRRVLQGEVIGYVGSSGLSTGPHLDYRIKRRGRYLDPLKAELPKGIPLPRSLRPAFQKILDERRTMFDNLPLLKEVQASPAAHEPTPGDADKRTSRL
ncbi:MAG: M23 family metallopeptidase [Nitrospinae bacterium]|nr:M23 family metallopeptidase [Nitrospinota bacterium]